MKRRQWTSQQKVKIVLEGLSGRPVGEICNQYEISQAQYYQWREHFLTNANRAFETAEQDRGAERSAGLLRARVPAARGLRDRARARLLPELLSGLRSVY